MQPSESSKRYTLKAPGLGLAGAVITCEVTGRLLRVGLDGLLADLTAEQATAFMAAGFEPVEGRAVLELRKVSDAYAKSAAAFAMAEDAAVAAIRFARLEGVDEIAIEEILSAAGKAHQTVLPSPAEIAGAVAKPAPAAPQAPAPAVEPAEAQKEEASPAPPAPAAAEKKPSGKKSLSAAALEAQAAQAAAVAAEPPAPAVEPAEPPKE